MPPAEITMARSARMLRSNKQVANSLISVGSMVAAHKVHHLVVTSRERAVIAVGVAAVERMRA
jgi:ADP-glucose pyrophosphorylase